MSTASRYDNGKKKIEQYGPEHKVEEVSVTCVSKYANKLKVYHPRCVESKYNV